jgi:hypothetical protein
MLRYTRITLYRRSDKLRKLLVNYGRNGNYFQFRAIFDGAAALSQKWK